MAKKRPAKTQPKKQAAADGRDGPRPGPITRWMARHANATNFWLHMVGVPACFVAAPVLLGLGDFLSAGALFAGGYALQFLGHAVEGNQSGEGAILQRLCGGQKPPKA